MFRQMELLKRLLPVRVTLNPSTSIRLETLKNEQTDEAIDVLCDASSSGDGLSVDEFDKFPSVRQWILSHPVASVVEESSNEMIGLVLVRPSPLQRSTTPSGHAGYIALKSGRWRHLGIGKAMLSNIGALGTALGYRNLLGRTGMVSRSLVPIKNTNGRLPNSVNLKGVGWIDDIILYMKYPENATEDPPEPPDLPPLTKTHSIFESLQEFALPKPDHDFPPLILQDAKINGSFPVSLANTEDLWRAEEMVRQAARNGDGFALDEFTPEGHLNRRLLWDSNMLVAKEPSTGSVVAAAIFGRSALCRSPNTPQVGGQLIVHPDFQGKGVGSAFLKYCIEQAEKVGYKGILTDTFVTSEIAFRLATKSKFLQMGTLVDCGHVKGHGLTNSVVMYKVFGDLDWPSGHQRNMNFSIQR